MHSCERDYYELLKNFFLTKKKKIISKRDLSTWFIPSEVHLKIYLNKLHSDITSKEISIQKKKVFQKIFELPFKYSSHIWKILLITKVYNFLRDFQWFCLIKF